MIRCFFVLLALALPVGPGAGVVSAPPTTPGSENRGTAPSIEDEVLGNLLNQPIGETQTVADLQMPESFLRTVGDRVIRSSFEERHRIVVRDAAAGSPGPGVDRGATTPGDANTSKSRSSGWVRAVGLVLLIPIAVVAIVMLRRKKGASP